LQSAAIGFRAHSGWASLVAIALHGGAPMILSRRRVHLVETFTYTFRQPYHTGEKMPLAEARAFISQVETDARRLAFRAIRDVQKSLLANGFRLTHSALTLASGRPLPPLPRILSSHALIHTADGELFRRALLHAAARCKLPQFTARERDLPAAAAQTLRVKPNILTRRIADLGRTLGPPWTQDEKLATTVAWLSLL
jgi:hypothetical protein